MKGSIFLEQKINIHQLGTQKNESTIYSHIQGGIKIT